MKVVASMLLHDKTIFLFFGVLIWKAQVASVLAGNER